MRGFEIEGVSVLTWVERFRLTLTLDLLSFADCLSDIAARPYTEGGPGEEDRTRSALYRPLHRVCRGHH